MDYIKKVIKIISVIFIILLSSVGAGITGGIPPVSGNRKQDKVDYKMELFEEKEEGKEMQFFEQE